MRSSIVIKHEYQPGEYCEAVCCSKYNGGKFSSVCDECQAYVYYRWLKSNGYRLLLLEEHLDTEEI